MRIFKVVCLFFFCIFWFTAPMDSQIRFEDARLEIQFFKAKREASDAIKKKNNSALEKISEQVHGPLRKKVDEFMELAKDKEHKWRREAIQFGFRHLQELVPKIDVEEKEKTLLYGRGYCEKASDFMYRMFSLCKQWLMGDGEPEEA